MNIINLEVEILDTGVYKTHITNLLGNFSLEELSSDKFKTFLHHCLKHVVDYGDDELIFDDDIGEGYVFITLEKWLQDNEVHYGNVKSYYQPLL